MDRRQKKTRVAILAAFIKLLQNNRFSEITVQDIIDEADVGRSTFYAHFEGKDDLMAALCGSIFDRLRLQDVDRTGEEQPDLKDALTIQFARLKENSHNVRILMKSENLGMFSIYFREYLMGMFEQYDLPVPRTVSMNYYRWYLAGAFQDTLGYWLENGMFEAPGEIADMLMAVVGLEDMEARSAG